MAADVSSLVRILSEYKKKDEDIKNKTTHFAGDLVTRDFLGGCAAVLGSKELDLDLKVPSGWERRLDLLSGETYLEEKSAPLRPEVHDLNLPPPAAPDTSALDLKMLLPSCPRPAGAYQSVCTLDKVRSALERAGREPHSKTPRHQPQRSRGSASPSSSTTSSSIKRWSDQEADGPDSPAGLMAAGCPSCLMYVLISKGNPRCPRCDSRVPAPAAVVSKKPRIDLNSLEKLDIFQNKSRE